MSHPPGPTRLRSSRTGSGWHTSWGCGIGERRPPASSGSSIHPTCRAKSSIMIKKHQTNSDSSVSWPAFGDVTGEGLELGTGRPASSSIPDADQTPEQLAGLVPGVPPASQVARRLAESHCHVFVPTLIDRTVAPRNGRARLTNREFVYRSAFELGRHVIGYEVQKVLALVDALERESRRRGRELRVGIFGYGEGGAIALYAAALDPRIKAACVSGYFDDRNDVWRQPVDRNVFGLLEQFGDAEVASLVAPRTLIVEAARGPEFVIPPGTGGAPGRLTTPELGTVTAEVERARALVAGLESGLSDRDGRERTGRRRAVRDRRGSGPAPPGHRSGCPARTVRVGRGRRSTGSEDRRATRRGRSRPPGAATPRARPPQPAAPRREPLYSPGVHEEARHPLGRRLCAVGRAVPGVLRRGGHRPVRPRSRCRRMSARGGSTTSRGSPATRSSWTSSPTSSPTASCSCPRGSRRGSDARSSSASTAWRAGRATSPTRRSRIRRTTSSPSAWPSEDSSRSHPRISTSSRTASAPSSARRIRSRRRCSR